METGLDAERLGNDFEGKAKNLFNEDLELAKNLGVRGFPTIFFTDNEDNRLKIYGVKPYKQFEQTLLKLFPEAVKQQNIKDVETAFEYYPTFTLNEIATLTEFNKDKASTILNDLLEKGKVEKYSSKNGDLWKWK